MGEVEVLGPSLNRNMVTASVAPVATVETGASIEAVTQDAYGGRDATPAAVLEPDFFPGKLPVTGPIVVNGLKAGGWVGVDLDKLEPFPVGTLILRRGVGLLGRIWDGPPRPYRFTIEDGVAHNNEIGDFDARPMIGSISVAPPGSTEVWSGSAGEHVGNVDCPEFGPGAMMALPVHHDGAYIYLADGHARMGRGELGGTGIEVSMRVRMTLRALAGPRYDKTVISPAILAADGWFGAVGRGQNIESAAVRALDSLRRWLEHFECDEADARIALDGDVRVCQIVNNEPTVAVGLHPHPQLANVLARWRAGHTL